MTTPQPTGDAELVAEADAKLDRWLDREHHSFPSHPLATSVAAILYERRRLATRLASLSAELEGARDKDAGR